MPQKNFYAAKAVMNENSRKEAESAKADGLIQATVMWGLECCSSGD